MNHAALFSDLLLGTDLVSVSRLEENRRRHGMRFFERVLTAQELDYCRKSAGEKRPHEFLKRAAGRIAVKEAVSKVLGVGINGLGWAGGIPWQAVELVSENRQPPRLHLHGRAEELAALTGIAQWRVSLSHDGDYAMATVLGLRQATF